MHAGRGLGGGNTAVNDFVKGEDFAKLFRKRGSDDDDDNSDDDETTTTATTTTSTAPSTASVAAGDPFCSGPILAAVQAASLFPDCKTFVDLTLLVTRDECWRRWHALPQPPSDEALRAFVTETFSATPGEGQLEPWCPPDHTPSPPLLAQLPNGPVREWASAINLLWPQLGRRPAEAAARHPERHTLLPMEHGVIVPGGRFREAYYWDSLWAVLGLLECGMVGTARGLVANLLACVRTHGFVPNGLRRYYLNRSQPPMLPQMVAAILAHLDAQASPGGGRSRPAPAGWQTGAQPAAAATAGEDSTAAAREAALALLREALPALDAEYRWWMRGEEEGGSAVRLAADAEREAATLNRYVVDAGGAPRPESWREDTATAAGLPAAQRAALYDELAACAESGWDFSSRFAAPPPPPLPGDGDGDGEGEGADAGGEAGADVLRGLRTSAVVPVELNAILYRNERVLQRMHARLAKLLGASAEAAVVDAEVAVEVAAAAGRGGGGDGDGDDAAAAARAAGVAAGRVAAAAAEAAAAEEAAVRYARAAKARWRAMDEWLWSEAHGCWLDLDWRRRAALPSLSAACFTPLWAGAHADEQAAAAVAALRRSGLVQAGGVATTLRDTGQQWDGPNAWPPLQQMLIEGAAACGAEGGAELAEQIALAWLRSNHRGWARDGVMREKYDAGRPGESGGGGEYEAQVGFGWTNGVALWLLRRYGDAFAHTLRDKRSVGD